MARMRVRLGWVVKERARKANYKRRMARLTKKLEELNILCGVPSSMIAYGPREQEPVVWPSRAEADKLIRRFRGKPELERSNEKASLEAYLKELLAEAREEVAEQKKCNRELEAFHLVTQIQCEGKKITDFTKEEVAEIVWFMQEKMDAVDRRRQFLMASADQSQAADEGMLPQPDQNLMDPAMVPQFDGMGGGNGGSVTGSSTSGGGLVEKPAGDGSA